MTSHMKQCQATPSWTISVPETFTEIDNGDSWQAHAAARFVYVSSMKVARGGSPVPANALRASVAKKLQPHSEVERHELEGSSVVGDAQIVGKGAGFELKGFACTDGNVATCVISFDQPEDRDWAIATWKSLRAVSSPVKTRPWWRFW